MTIDVSRLSDGVVLSPEVSNTILADTQEASFVQRLATKINMPGSGVQWQTITGEPEAGWVSETEEKPVSRPTFGEDAVAPYKMAVIVPFSDEFKRDAGRLFSEVQRRIPNALARLFDRTVLGLVDAPGEHFDQLSDAAAVEFDATSAETAYQSLVDVEEALVDAGGWNTGYALSPKTRVTLMRVTDGSGQSVFTTGQNLAGGTLLGAPVAFSRHIAEVPDLLGVAGDWSAAQWGTVEGVQLSMSTESTLTETYDDNGTPTTRTLNLWQRNMFALRAEIEVAFKADGTKFARLTNAA